MPWIIPTYEVIGTVTSSPLVADVALGFSYLIVFALVLTFLIFAVILLNNKKS
jgi:hypothetical protein